MEFKILKKFDFKSIIMIIRSKAPLRISFAGGGTDVPPFPYEYGGSVLSCTIDKYAYTSVIPNSRKKISIKSIDFNLQLCFLWMVGLGIFVSYCY